MLYKFQIDKRILQTIKNLKAVCKTLWICYGADKRFCVQINEAIPNKSLISGLLRFFVDTANGYVVLHNLVLITYAFLTESSAERENLLASGKCSLGNGRYYRLVRLVSKSQQNWQISETEIIQRWTPGRGCARLADDVRGDRSNNSFRASMFCYKQMFFRHSFTSSEFARSLRAAGGVCKLTWKFRLFTNVVNIVRE